MSFRQLAFLFLIFCSSPLASSLPVEIDDSLFDIFSTNEDVSLTLIISMAEGRESQANRQYLHQLKNTPIKDRTERLNTVYETLLDHSNRIQHDLLSFLEQESIEFSVTFKQLWISNQVILWNVNKSLLEKLLLRSDIGRIEKETFFILDPPEKDIPFSMRVNAEEYQWGVQKIRAPIVYNVTKGEGIVVASIDTGALWTHEALKNNYRDDHGWFDAVGNDTTEYPYDDRGHGTHTIGTMVGTMQGIGVAPGSQWIACKAGNSEGSFSSANILECAQWVLCPTDYLGGNPDCSKAPRIVSNSWGGEGGRHIYDDAIAAWRAAGIIPVFSIGNNGPDCWTAGYPGEHPDVIGVGSTTVNDIISSFSSVGPIETYPGIIKPEISAPGSSVYSATYDGDTSYGTKSGTSMACPHVTGLIALMLSEEPNLNYEEIRDLLQRGAVHTVATGATCNSVSDTQYPNFHVGYGRVDAVNTFGLIGQ